MVEQTSSGPSPAGANRPPTFRHYRLLVEDARALSDRRDRVTTIFLSVITLTLGAQGYLLATTKDGEVRATILVWAIAFFGTWLCLTWRRALLTFKELLNFRYFTLKQWEGLEFPDDEQYYVAEDVLYHVHEKTEMPLPPLADEYVRQRGKKLIPYFSDTYRRLPAAALWALWGIAIIRGVFFALTYVHGGVGVQLGI